MSLRRNVAKFCDLRMGHALFKAIMLISEVTVGGKRQSTPSEATRHGTRWGGTPGRRSRHARRRKTERMQPFDQDLPYIDEVYLAEKMDNIANI